MAYLMPSMGRTANILARAESGLPQGDEIGTNRAFGTFRHVILSLLIESAVVFSCTSTLPDG